MNEISFYIRMSTHKRRRNYGVKKSKSRNQTVIIIIDSGKNFQWLQKQAGKKV